MSLADRVQKLEAAYRDDPLLIFTHELDDGHGGLILVNDRNGTCTPVEVGRVPAADVAKHRRTVIRLNRPADKGRAS